MIYSKSILLIAVPHINTFIAEVVVNKNHLPMISQTLSLVNYHHHCYRFSLLHITIAVGKYNLEIHQQPKIWLLDTNISRSLACFWKPESKRHQVKSVIVLSNDKDHRDCKLNMVMLPIALPAAPGFVLVNTR